MSEETYKLEELAHAAGTSARTVRYYVQRGLLPAPRFRGKDTAYDGEHLARLKAIRRLQEDFLPLDAIAAELERRTPREILEERRAARSVASPTAEPMPERTWRRIELAPGVELAVAHGASASSIALVERILNATSKMKEGV